MTFYASLYTLTKHTVTMRYARDAPEILPEIMPEILPEILPEIRPRCVRDASGGYMERCVGVQEMGRR